LAAEHRRPLFHLRIRRFVGEAALLIDLIVSGLPTNQPDEIRRTLGAEIRPSFWDWPRTRSGAEWFAMLSGQSFETLEASILGPSDFVPKLTLFETLLW
jgi:hypothetical protein